MRNQGVSKSLTHSDGRFLAPCGNANFNDATAAAPMHAEPPDGALTRHRIETGAYLLPSTPSCAPNSSRGTDLPGASRNFTSWISPGRMVNSCTTVR